MTSPVRRSRAAVGAGVLAAAAAGLLVTRLDAIGTLVVSCALGVGVLGFLTRQALRRSGHAGGAPQAVGSVRPESQAVRLRVPRFFYYLGVLFIGQLTFRLPLGFTLSDWCFLASFGTASAVVLSNRWRIGHMVPKTALWPGVVLFSAGGLISSLSAANPSSSLATLARFTYLTVVWFLLGAVVLVRREHLQRAVSLWVISIAVSGAAAVAQLFFGDVIPSTAITFGRMTGFTQHVNDLGGMTSIALAPAVVLAIRRSTPTAQRLVAAGCGAFIAAGLVLSGSVGGMMAGFVAMLVVISSGRSAGRLLILGGAVVAVMVLALGPASTKNAVTPVTRINEATGGAGRAQNTLHLRLGDYRQAWERIQDSPLVGVGLGPDNGVVRAGLQVHNMLLGPWFEAGALGAVGMVVILMAIGTMARRVSRTADDPDDWRTAIALSAAFLAFLVFGLGAPVLFQRYGWVCAALLVAMRAQQRAGVRAREASLESTNPVPVPA